MISAAGLNVPFSGAARQNVYAIKFSGVQNRALVSHMTTIDHTQSCRDGWFEADGRGF